MKSRKNRKHFPLSTFHFPLLAGLALAASGSAQELWHVGKPADVYGIYFMVPQQFAATGNRGIEQIQNGRYTAFNGPPMNVNAKVETMVGRIDATMKDEVYKELACHHYTTTYTVQAPRVTGLKNLVRRIESWIDFKGVVKRVRSYYQDERKIVQIDALFENDTIEMDVIENGKQRHLSMTPAEGLAAFNNPLPEMIKNADKDRQEKLFCTIDPATGGILKYTLRLKGKFVPPVGSSSKIKGFTIEVKSGTAIHNMFVADDMQLRQIDFADTSVVRAVQATTLGGG